MKIMIAIPCQNKIDTLFAQSCIGLRFNEPVDFRFCAGSLVYDSRNKLANMAIDEGFDIVLWIDSDMVFKPDLLEQMLFYMEHGQIDYLSALCFKRNFPIEPVIYKRLYTEGDKNKSEAYSDYPKNSFFEVAGSGFGCVMTSVKLLKDVRDKWGLPFSPRLGWGEDISFCLMARDCGYRMYCCSSIKVGHITTQIVDEMAYEAMRGKKKWV